MDEEFVQYIEESGQMELLKSAALQYKSKLYTYSKKYKTPFLFCIHLDFLELGNVSHEFQDLFLSEPITARLKIQEIIHKLLPSLAELPSISLEQIAVSIRIDNFPIMPDLTVDSIKEPTGLVLLQGVLMSKTTTYKYVRSSVYRCSSRSCQNYATKRIPGTKFYSKCVICGSDNEEILQARDVGDEVTGCVVPHRAFKKVKDLSLISHYSATAVCFQDDMIDDLQLGVQYDITGYYYGGKFHAWSVKKWVSRFCIGNPTSLSVKPFPPSIQELYDDVRNSCPQCLWAFVTVLASYIASDLYPIKAFLPLKTALLLSLATQNNTYQPVSILAVTQEPDVTRDLMNWAAKLARRFLFVNSTSSCSAIGAMISTQDTEIHTVEAGPLLLATGGVCYLGEWEYIRKSSTLRSHVLSAIEQKEITVQKDKTLDSTSTVGEPTLPLKCVVWTYLTSQPKLKPAEIKEINTLMKYFGVPFTCNVGIYLEEITRFMLENAMQRKKRKCIIPAVEIKEIVAMANGMTVELSEEASKLIKNYFVMVRELRNNALPVDAITTITSLAEAHAKLSYHSEVTFEDALVVLYLYEASLSTMFGPCFLNTPPVVLQHKNMKICHQIEQMLMGFRDWVTADIRAVLRTTD